ncbi:hypothetical protein D8674_037576 [Pyrus ussuriensis x Pyrus communis]|uniref:Nodulin-like domain-containing protein n=1 Tax=Pyrus ussuriensis x Pyrus communis TaxID=2448454 RepID=A0A5N5FMA5_9ROSA|nr:hypothetical protein D8674_037576 [Pyrus ussuriensis x Pyrus communis]
MSDSGTIYLFGTYSKELKPTFGYDQETCNLLGFFKDLGANISIFAGLIAEVTPTWFVLLIGAATNFFGYFMMWLGVTGKIAKPEIWHMCVYMYITTNSLSFVNRHYGYLRQKLPTKPRRHDLLCGSQLLKINNKNDNSKVFYRFLYLLIVLALFLMAMTLTQKSVVFPRAAQATTAAVVCFLLLIPLLIIIREELVSWTLTKQEPSRIALEETQEQGQRNQGPQELELDREIKPKGTSFFSNIFKKPPRGEDYTILQAILSIDMLLIFIAKLFGLGSSFTATDNLGQIDEALGYKPQTINAFVSLISIWNFLCSLNERRQGSEGRVEDQSEVGLPVQSCQTKAPLPYDPHVTGGITAGGATPDNSCGLSGECEEASKGLEAENYEPRSKRR